MLVPTSHQLLCDLGQGTSPVGTPVSPTDKQAEAVMGVPSLSKIQTVLFLADEPGALVNEQLLTNNVHGTLGIGLCCVSRQ